MSDKKYIWILLILFIIIGGYLRFYHIDFPTIGLHNMKENEQISEAKIMLNGGSWLHSQTYNFWGLESGSFENNSGAFEEYVQPKILAYMISIGWVIIGSQPVWLPRLIIIIFSLISIILMYLLVKKLTENDYMALLSSFLFAIMPISVFFGRNIQPDMPALCFSIASIYFFLRWRESFSKKDIFITMLFLGISALFKETFLITILPLLFIVPYKRLYDTKFGELCSHIGCGLLGLIPFVAIQEFYTWIVIDKTKIISESLILSSSRVVSLSYWTSGIPPLFSYFKDNFTWWFLIMALCGIVLACIKYKSLIGRLTIGYLISLIPYCTILSGKLFGHHYYQLFYLPLICISLAYFLFNFGNIIKQLTKLKFVEYLPLIIIPLVFFSFISGQSSIQASNERMFGTVFYGQDIAGEWIKEHTLPTDRFFIYGHSQTLAACTFAERRCGQPWNESVDNNMLYLETVNGPIERMEQEFNIRYIELDLYGLSVAQSSSNWQYIQDNYKIVWTGFLNVNGQLTPQNFILKRNGRFNLSDLQDKQPYLATTYKMSFGDVPFYVIEVNQ